MSTFRFSLSEALRGAEAGQDERVEGESTAQREQLGPPGLMRHGEGFIRRFSILSLFCPMQLICGGDPSVDTGRRIVTNAFAVVQA